MNGDEPIQTTRDENGVKTEVPPRTAQALLVRQRERKAKSILLLAISDEYQQRFHTIKDAKSLWAAIKSRFGGNVESKKVQKTVLKQQFENFFVSDTEGLDKAYDRNKEGINELDIDDLYNNLKVFEADIKGSSGSFSNSQNMVFLFAEDDEDLEQIDHDDLEEMDRKWQMDMLSMRSTKKSREHEWRCKDGLGYDWSCIAQEEPTKFALMAYTSGTDTEKNEVAYEEKIAVLEFKVNDKVWLDLRSCCWYEGSFKCWLITTPQMIINSQCLTDKKELAIPRQMATGKELSNPLMAGSLPKTTLPTKLLNVNAARPKLTTARVYAAEIKYALTASLTIHTSCIKQFWTSNKVKTVNDEVWIQALVDGKRVNIKKSSIRRILKLDDDEEVRVPLFMFSRFVQLIINHQLGDMTHHKDIFATFSLTKKFFANMKKVGTGFSREVTLLFANMLVQAPEEKKHKPKKKHTKEPEVPPTESQAEQSISLPLPSHDLLPSGEDSLKLKELMYLCTNLSNKVLDLDSEVIDIKSTFKEKIENDEEPADVEEVLEVVTTAKLITKVVTTAMDDVNAASVQDTPITTAEATKVTVELESELNADINWNVVIEQVKRSERLTDAVMKCQALKRKPLTEAQARRNIIVYLKNMAGYKMNYFKGMSYDEIRPLFEMHYNYNQTFLDEVNEGVKVSEKEVRQEKEVEVESSKREDDDDDDVYTDATPLASKIPIVDYKIQTKRNRPYFKIIRADGNHIERFEKTEPKNYSDDYLLNTLKIMFEKPNVEANVWKDQKGKYGLAKVKSWKLIESCRVHCLTLLTT
nr:xylulose kinase-1 [Tanacetum cinerariifolium]